MRHGYAMVSIRAALLVCGCASLLAVASAQEDGPLFDALVLLSDTEDGEAAQLLIDAIDNGLLEDEDWEALFERFFAEYPFTISHARFWSFAIEQTAGPPQATMAFRAALCAVEALVQSVKADPGEPVWDWIREPVAFLQRLSAGLGPELRAQVFDKLTQRLSAAGDVEMGTALRRGLSPQAYPQYIQTALTIAEYMPNGREYPAQVGQLLGLPEPLRPFWESHGIFLFDEGALTPQHIASIDSLFGAVPNELHLIGAVVFPESTGVTPNSVAFANQVQILYLPVMPMGLMTDPTEFTPFVVQRSAPRFTINAAHQLAYAIQEVQVVRNPGLVLRRDLILGHARDQEERYVRRKHIIDPATYLADPASFLPSLAILWFTDSIQTFAMGIDLFEIDMRDGMDSLLLLADMLSNGTNTSLVIRTLPDGQVQSVPAPVGRTHLARVRMPRPFDPGLGGEWIDADFHVLSAIVIDGRDYRFNLGEMGGVIHKFFR